MNKRVLSGIGIAIFVISAVFIASSNGYNKRCSKGIEDYKNENHFYYDRWDLTETSTNNHYSESIWTDESNFRADRIEHDFYSLDWKNYVLSDEGFEIFCITPEREDSRCELRIVDLDCVSETDPLDPNYNCSKTIIYRPEVQYVR